MWKAFLKMEIRNNKNVVDFYMDSFREGDHEQTLSCLTDDVEWNIHGHKSIKGKEAFDMEIENENFEGKPAITVNRLIEENNVVVAEGTVLAKPKNNPPVLLAFCDVFEFREGKISKLTSYLTPMN